MQTFVILNPVAGRAEAATVRRALRQHLAEDDYQIYETTGREDLGAVVNEALANGADRIVTAGGDGTISGAADALAGSGVPLGIVPTGTGNSLATVLGIPQAVDAAVALLAGAHKIAPVDVMQVGERIAILNASAGITSVAVPRTARRVKRLLGRLAYFWNILRRVVGFQPVRFALRVDGQRRVYRASEVLVGNGLFLDEAPLDWGPAGRLRDRRLDVYVIRARHLLDYAAMLAGILLRRRRLTRRHLRHLSVTDSLRITAVPSLPVQADGERVGRTPVDVRVRPGALRVLVPPNGYQ